jgi:hypothetical protein
MSGGSKAQQKAFGKTRSSSFTILIELWQRHHTIVERAVESPAHVLAALKALKRGLRTPPEDDHGALLKAAEAMMEEVSPYKNSLMPFELTGLLKYSVIYQDALSPRLSGMLCSPRQCQSLPQTVSSNSQWPIACPTGIAEMGSGREDGC